MNTSEDSFIREVDEELRRDRLVGFWVRYGRSVIALVLVGLAALAGWLVWQEQQLKQSRAESEILDDAMRKAASGGDAAAIKSLDGLKTSSNDGYRASAMLTEAALKLQKRDPDGAAKIYAKVAADETLPTAWRDLALVRQTAAQYDRVAPDEVIARLSKLAVKGNPWFGSAGEMVAIAYIKKQRFAEAAKLFDEISADKSVPESIRKRATDLSASLSAVPPAAATQGTSK
ncbi:MAG: tetratricopeptide repeat protein [Chakrabartia sp.]